VAADYRWNHNDYSKDGNVAVCPLLFYVHPDGLSEEDIRHALLTPFCLPPILNWYQFQGFSGHLEAIHPFCRLKTDGGTIHTHTFQQP
jgi:hypothetical protein